MSQQQPPIGQQQSQSPNTQQPQHTQGYGQPQQYQESQGSKQPKQQQFQQSQGYQQSRQSQHGQEQGSPFTRASFPTRNVLPEQIRSGSIATLNQCLADATVIFTQCKTAHWNVKGPDFYQLHELFDDLAEMVEAHIDEIAERVTALGGLAAGTARDAAQSANVPQYPTAATDERTVLESVADSLAAFDATLQEQIMAASSRDDLDTADLLNEVSREVSKALWFVEAHLQGEAATGSQGASQLEAQHGQTGQSSMGQAGGQR